MGDVLSVKTTTETTDVSHFSVMSVLGFSTVLYGGVNQLHICCAFLE